MIVDHQPREVLMNPPDSVIWIRNSAYTVARGFLLGVGFSIALGLAGFIMTQWTMHRTQATISDERYVHNAGTAEFSPKDIVLSDIEEQKHEGLTWIVGSARNSGKRPASSVEIQANLFNHSKFVDQYSTYLPGKLNPGESKYFKIACGCKDSPAAEHDSFKVEVVGGY
jgi:hypothetical protein